MAGRKQVMDLHPETNGISRSESDEQQRNWSQDKWQRKAKEPLSNYDPTRAHLNFEVTRGGVVQPIDTSKTIAEKMAESLAARGIKDPNARPNVRRKQRTIAKFIFGGNRERMHELAFGAQQVDLHKGTDNSHITRCKDIENWARDVYNFVAKKYGEENIVSFYVHLDEKNPHAHCTLVPVDKEKNRISWVSVFGKNKYEEGAHLTMLHTDLEREVSRKYGLERGSNKAETQARHRSTEEYKRDLISEVCSLETTREGLLKQIHRAEIKLKGISTMIANLQTRREEIQEQIDQIARQFGQEGTDNAELAARMAKLRQELVAVDEKLATRKKMLDETNTTLAAAKVRLADLTREHNRLQAVVGNERDTDDIVMQRNLLAVHSDMVAHSLQSLMPTLSERQQEILEENGYNELTQSSPHIINCALLLVGNYIHEATNYAVSHGGGGSSSMSGWGRGKDEDDEMWWRRCISKASSLMRPAGRKIKRGR